MAFLIGQLSSYFYWLYEKPTVADPPTPIIPKINTCSLMDELTLVLNRRRERENIPTAPRPLPPLPRAKMEPPAPITLFEELQHRLTIQRARVEALPLA